MCQSYSKTCIPACAQSSAYLGLSSMSTVAPISLHRGGLHQHGGWQIHRLRESHGRCPCIVELLASAN